MVLIYHRGLTILAIADTAIVFLAVGKVAILADSNFIRYS
jgi:hypothetical protein